MGIAGLLPFLKDAHRQVNLKTYAGCTVAVDTYCWLHKGAFSCVEKLATGEKTTQYINYCMKYVNMLLRFGIKPIMVFDGCHLPSKANVEKERRQRRKVNRDKAAQLLREGKRAEARSCLEKCIDITPEMAHNLMVTLREAGVDYVVAPYEADAQLAYLNKSGIAQIVISEDSDLLLFGCERVVYKLDVAGNGIMIEQSDLNKCSKISQGFYTFEKFRYMCILSGCDYLASLPGIGLGKALKVLKNAREPDILKVVKKLSTYLNSSISVPQEYVEEFDKANKTFLYQLVFDTQLKKLVPLNPYKDDIEPQDLQYAGPSMSKEKASQIAAGNLNVNNGEKVDNFNPYTYKWPKRDKQSSNVPHLLSIWDKGYRPVKAGTSLTSRIPEVERPSTLGKEVMVKVKIKVAVNNLQAKSPSKRSREDEQENETSLTSLYGCHVNKKQRMIDDSDSDDEEHNISHTEIIEENMSAFDIIDSNNDSEDKSEGEEETVDDLANQSLSPSSNNVFATEIPKKTKFDINMTREKPREVKSRFFAKQTVKQKTLLDSLDESSASQLEGFSRNLRIAPFGKSPFPSRNTVNADKVVTNKSGLLRLKGFKPIPHTEAEETTCNNNVQEYENKVSEYNDSDSVLNTISLLKDRKKDKASLFSWKKFTSCHDKKEKMSTSVSCSPACSQQFRPVFLSQPVTTSNTGEPQLDFTSCTAGPQLDNTSNTAELQLDNTSNTAEEDVFCKESQVKSRSSDEENESEISRKTVNESVITKETLLTDIDVNAVQEDNGRVIVECVDLSNEDSLEKFPSKSPSKEHLFGNGRSSNTSLLGPAKSIGLSKKAKAKPKLDNRENQAKISNFFSKFKSDRSKNMERLQISQQSVLDSFDSTPESEKTSVKDFLKVQRKLVI